MIGSAIVHVRCGDRITFLLLCHNTKNEKLLNMFYRHLSNNENMSIDSESNQVITKVFIKLQRNIKQCTNQWHGYAKYRK